MREDPSTHKEYGTIQIKKLSSMSAQSDTLLPVTSRTAEKGRKDILRRMKVIFLMRNMDANHVFQGS